MVSLAKAKQIANLKPKLINDPEVERVAGAMLAAQTAIKDGDKIKKELAPLLMDAMENTTLAKAGKYLLTRKFRAGSEDTVITPEMVGQILPGRAAAEWIEVKQAAD